jgi:hypothetical protein
VINFRSMPNGPPASLIGDRLRPKRRRLSVAFMLLVWSLAANSGCSQPRKIAEEVDWGQPKSPVARRKQQREAATERAREQPSDQPAEDRRDGGGGAGGGGTASSAKSDSSASGNEAAGEPAASGLQGSGAGGAPGTDGGGPGGVGDVPPPRAPDRPAPALPGRKPIKPALSVEDAAASAKQLLERAQHQLRAADASAAVATAIEAYDQVLPHAETDAECKKLCGLLEGVLNAAGRTQGRADAVPTRFE